MKKMTVKVCPELIIGHKPHPGIFERFEVLTLFNIGADVPTRVCRFRLRKGYAVEDIARGKILQDFTILSADGRDHTCIMKGELPGEINRFIRTFDIKLEYPIILEKGTGTINLVGSPEELHAIFASAAENGWKMEILAVRDYDPHIGSIFSVLTRRQKEILIAAYRHGYFDYPRRVDAGRLAELMGIHKTTLLEHIRKAERRLISHILAQTE